MNSNDELRFHTNSISEIKIGEELSKQPVKNIWKFAVALAYSSENGTIMTKDLLEIIPNIYRFSDEDKEIYESTGKPVYVQKIKNIKSNRKNTPNPLYSDYLEDIKDGFKITEKGKRFRESKDFVNSFLE